MRGIREEIRQLERSLRAQGYVADRALATALSLAMSLGKPLLVEGPAGVGKTAVAKALAEHLGAPLIRLQCYEGLDQAQALYEWNYPKQLLRIRMGADDPGPVEEREKDIFSEEYLLRRPLLQAISAEDRAPVLLIDEIDRADEAFEAFLLEVLSDFQVTIPEIGTVRATHPPHVILTSNRTRELADALRRRCLYQWVPYPDREKERAILEARVPGIDHALAVEIARVMAALRAEPLVKTPGVAESLDWALALTSLGVEGLDGEVVAATLSCVLKDRDDVAAWPPEAVLELGRPDADRGEA